MDKYGYYFRIQDKVQYPFDFKFNTKFRMKHKRKNTETLIKKIKDNEIKLVPNFGWGSLGDGLVEYCKINKKYLLTITRIKEKNIY